jgi:calmodulin
MRESFDRFDSDRNGQIELAEFRLLLDSLGADLQPSAVESAFDAIDADENGFVDFDEFAIWWKTACFGD